MKVKCLQMDMKFASPDENFAHAEELISAAASDADVLVLPETWNTGFFPKENLKDLCDKEIVALWYYNIFGIEYVLDGGKNNADNITNIDNKNNIFRLIYCMFLCAYMLLTFICINIS